MIVRYPWRRGSVTDVGGSVVISATKFTYKRFRDLPVVTAHAMRLRSGWPKRPGAVGLLVGGQPWRRTTYSVSVWESEEDLRRFLRAPDHVPLVRDYRPRLEASTSSVWEADGLQPAEAWREGMRRVGAAT